MMAVFSIKFLFPCHQKLLGLLAEACRPWFSRRDHKSMIYSNKESLHKSTIITSNLKEDKFIQKMILNLTAQRDLEEDRYWFTHIVMKQTSWSLVLHPIYAVECIPIQYDWQKNNTKNKQQNEIHCISSEGNVVEEIFQK